MTAMLASTPLSNSAAKIPQTTGIRKNGKTWKDTKAPFRKTTGTSKNAYAKRVERQSRETAVKAAEKQLKAEKDEEREVSIHQVENEDWVPPTSKFWGYQNVKDWDRKFWDEKCTKAEEEYDGVVSEEEVDPDMDFYDNFCDDT